MTTVSHTVCPFCGYEHELASAVVESGSMPKTEPRMAAGDATMCIACGEMAVMGNDDMLRKPTRAEGAQLASDKRVQLMQEAWRDMKRARSRTSAKR